MSDDPRTFYHRRHRRNQKRTLVNKTLETITPVEDQVSEKTEFEFVINYGATTFVFGFDSDSVPTEADASVIHDLVLRGTSCDDDEFEMFGLEIEMTENLNAIAIMKELIEKVSQVRSEMSAYDALPQANPVDSNVDSSLLSQQTETTMNNATNTSSSSSSINDETTMKNETTAMNQAFAQAAANATDAAEKITATTEQAAPSAAAAIAAGATMAAATGLVATKGFVARNKKKLLIAGGLVGLSVGGYFAWQRYGAALLGAGEAAAEAVVDQVAA